MRPASKGSPQSGMTLLEVMIALGILAVLGVMTARTIRDYDESRRKYRSQIIQESELRDAMNIMRSDIASAFHFRDIIWEIDTEALRATPSPSPAAPGASPAPPTGQPGTSPTPDPAASPNPSPTPLAGAPGSSAPTPPPVEPLPSPIPLTGLFGTSDSLYLTVNNHQRRQADSQESDLARVGYTIRSCRPRDPKRSGESIKCLVRSSLPSLGAKVDADGEQTVLLRHVAEFRLRYLPQRPVGESLDDLFVDAWKSDGSGFASGGGGGSGGGLAGAGQKGEVTTSTQFPAAVEIYIKTEDPSNPLFRPQVMTVLAPIRFPNNPRPQASPSTGVRQ